MSPSEILAGIRAIESGAVPASDISDVLLRGRCMAWLKAAYPDRLNPAQSALNRIAVRERFRACTPLFGAMDGVPYAVIKGAVLSRDAYGDECLRASGDIDLLINRRHLDAVKALLQRLGFVQGRVTPEGVEPFTRRELIFQNAMSHQTAPFVKETGNPLCPYVNVDVNLDIFWGEGGHRADMEEVLSHTLPDSLFGVPFQKLSPVYAFLSLCLHHYKDMHSLYLLSEGGWRLDQLCDILYVLKNNPPDMAALLDACRVMGAADYLYVCVYYAKRLCPHPALSACLTALDGVRQRDLTECCGLNDAERRPWAFSFEERLFDPSFPRRFYESLSAEEKQKVSLNRALM